MIVIPVFTKVPDRGPHVLILVLEKENIDRMKTADPLDFQPRKLGLSGFADAPIHKLDIVIAYEDDLEPLLELNKAGDFTGMIRYLERGRKHQPGDATPPIRMR